MAIIILPPGGVANTPGVYNHGKCKCCPICDPEVFDALSSLNLTLSTVTVPGIFPSSITVSGSAVLNYVSGYPWTGESFFDNTRWYWGEGEISIVDPENECGGTRTEAFEFIFATCGTPGVGGLVDDIGVFVFGQCIHDGLGAPTCECGACGDSGGVTANEFLSFGFAPAGTPYLAYNAWSDGVEEPFLFDFTAVPSMSAAFGGSGNGCTTVRYVIEEP